MSSKKSNKKKGGKNPSNNVADKSKAAENETPATPVEETTKPDAKASQEEVTDQVNDTDLGGETDASQEDAAGEDAEAEPDIVMTVVHRIPVSKDPAEDLMPGDEFACDFCNMSTEDMKEYERLEKVGAIKRKAPEVDAE